MMTLSATDARKTFFELIKKTNQQHEIFEIHHKSGNAIIMSAQEYESLKETLHLLSEPSFKDKFETSIKQANRGETTSFEEVFGEPL
ncbi:MAG: type II toxin-antitoxin system Phd/YefM family antitoxin [Thiomicrorhabdus sp.]|nr:type II toxin-antitoxin system Phd/YefM family antitoxin [Thiomicrorhabdus sp.]MCF6299460.1 type II toxin-antitoxin system Phd/YefM family antitoxin [Thiomicrorhabdus sp.]